MNEKQLLKVSFYLLPKLEGLLLARKQARWQWHNAAQEHKALWQAVLDKQDEATRMLEQAITDQTGLNKFRVKREIVK